MANRPPTRRRRRSYTAVYAPAIFDCVSSKMATRTLRELEEGPRMFKSVLQSPYNLKWLVSYAYDAVEMCTRLVKIAQSTRSFRVIGLCLPYRPPIPADKRVEIMHELLT